MKKLGRIIAFGVIILSVLNIVLAVVSVVNIWRYHQPVIETLANLASVTESGLETANTALMRLDPLLELLQGSMVDVQKNAEELKSDFENSAPIMDALSELTGRDIKPNIERAEETFESVHSTVNDLNAIIKTVTMIPFVNIPDIAQASQDIVDLLDEIAAGVEELDQGIKQIKTGIKEQVIQPIQDRAEQMEAELARTREEVQELQTQVEAAHRITVEVRPRIPQIITMISVLITIQLIWGIFAQIALIYLSWIYLRYKRLDLHQILSERVGEEESA